MNILDTIAAVSTPYGKGGIAVIRISGADAISVAEKMFVPKNGSSLSHLESNRAIYGDIFVTDSGKKQQIDDGIAVIFRSPASFTGEDAVEISCHGGVLLTQKVLTSILSSGARLAAPGEFTKRAFINGKLTLSRAEALGDLLEASTDDQIFLARSGMKGNLSKAAREIYDSLCSVLAAVYAKIDYPDEDLAEIDNDEMLSVAKDNLEKLQTLSKTYSTGHAIGEGIPTAIVGRTNAGKSTLYNRIVGRDAAIVTDIEGTTRDILTETARLGRVTLRLSDTAGLRESTDTVERIGIERARRSAEDAELILAVFDGSREPDRDDVAFSDYLSTLNAVKIAVINKSDRGTDAKMSAICEKLDYSLCMSADSGEGFDALRRMVEDIYIDHDLDMGKDAVIANARQNAAISAAAGRLSYAISSIERSLPIEVSCVEIENTLASLGEIDGRTVNEDIVAKIFSNFCVGK